MRVVNATMGIADSIEVEADRAAAKGLYAQASQLYFAAATLVRQNFKEYRRIYKIASDTANLAREEISARR